MNNVEMVILANSIKHGQCCVAGKNLSDGQWVRPVANERGAELSRNQILVSDYSESVSARPMQKVSMNLKKHVPLKHQPENFCVDSSRWRQTGAITVRELEDYLDHPKDLWGPYDRVAYERIESGVVRVSQSLYLIRVDQLRLYRNSDNKRRASFNYQESKYDLAVTDPKFDMLMNAQEGCSNIICVSLGEPFYGNSDKASCYKIVAAIF